MEGRSKTTAIILKGRGRQETVREREKQMEMDGHLTLPYSCPTLLPECWLCSLSWSDRNKTLSEELFRRIPGINSTWSEYVIIFYIPLVLVCYTVLWFFPTFPNVSKAPSSFQTFKEFLKYPVCKQSFPLI